MRKKAEISMETVVIAVIALLVLVVIIFIFSSQVGGVNNKLSWFRGHTGDEWCMSAGFNRKCSDTTSCTGDKFKDGTWMEVPKPSYCTGVLKEGGCFKSSTSTDIAEMSTQFKDCTTNACCERQG